MLIRRQQVAPEGSWYARHVFDESLGTAVQLKVEGEVIGEATLIGAVPSDDYRSVELTWRVEEMVGDWFLRFHDVGLTLDEYIPPLAFNPEAALEKVRRANARRDVPEDPDSPMPTH